jgi:Ca2+-binding RTX toxin-like protein
LRRVHNIGYKTSVRASVLAAAAVLALLVPATASAASYELRVRDGQVELVRDGHLVATGAPGAHWAVRGTADVDDTLTVRNPDGGLVPAHVTYSGGDRGFDSLVVAGGRSERARATTDGPDSGSIVHTRGSETLSVDYSGLEPITDTTPAANFVITYGPADDAITIDNGVAPADGQLRTDTPTTEEIEFANKTNVTISGGDGSDTFTIANTETATGLTGTLTATTGAEAGESISVGTANYSGATLMLVTTGAISDLNGAGTANVTATGLGADAGAAVDLDTAVARLEADTDTGNVTLRNTGDIMVGGLSNALHGLRVGGDTAGGNGQIHLATTGSLTLDDASGPEAVRSGFAGAGVTLVAGTTIGTTVGQDAARAPVGSVGLVAADFAIAAGSELAASSGVLFQSPGDVALGGPGSGAAISDEELDQVTASSLAVLTPTVLRVTGPVSIDPARVPLLELVADGSVEQSGGPVTSRGLAVLAGSTATLTTAQNDVDTLHGLATSMSFTDADDLALVAGTTGGVRATSADVDVRAGGGLTVDGEARAAGEVRLSAGGADGLLDNNAAVSGASTALTADRMALGGGSVNAGVGSATLAPASPGRPLDLGAPDDPPGSLNLTDAELDTVTAGALRVGNLDGGQVTVSEPIAPANAPSLALHGQSFVGPGGVTAQQLAFATGSATPRDWTIDAAAVSDGNVAIPYSSATTLAVTAGADADTFAVKASPTTAIAIDAGDPSNAPGDLLVYDREGRGVGGDLTVPDGQIESQGVQPVSFTRVETLDLGRSGACANPRGGSPGADVIGGSPRGDLISGAAGNDLIRGFRGADCLNGDAGADRVFGARGSDRLRGGSGRDRLQGGRGGDRILRGEAGADVLAGGGGEDRVAGGKGRDQVSGGGRADFLSGGPGRDRLFAGGGRNRLFGRSGDDLIGAANGKRDTIGCGSGVDRVVADLFDRVRGCERVNRS